MPRMRLCQQIGCHAVAAGKFCPRHAGAKADRRLSAARRGYDRRWRRVRRVVLGAEPLCADCGRLASEVHHKRALRDGGDDRAENLLPLCKACHSARTRAGE